MKQAIEADHSHLTASVRAALSLSDEERIQRVMRDRWIGYTRASKILDDMEDLYNSPRVIRPQNMLIVGRTNNGKSAIAKQFLRRHPAFDDESADEITAPVIMVSAPNVADEDRFYMAILDKIFAPYKASDKPSAKQREVIRNLARIGTKVLIIDDIHNILVGATEKTRQFLTGIRVLGNELGIPIVGTGIQTAIQALNNDKQLENRFQLAPLPRWQFDEDYLRLLASFERMLPLRRPSNLIETNLATKLFGMSEGILGELSGVLSKATIQAIRSGREQINKDVLEAIGWVAPSDRGKVEQALL